MTALGNLQRKRIGRVVNERYDRYQRFGRATPAATPIGRASPAPPAVIGAPPRRVPRSHTDPSGDAARPRPAGQTFPRSRRLGR